MKNKLCISLFLVVTTIFITSCGSRFAGANDFARFKKGMDFSKEAGADSDDIPLFQFEFDNQMYKCHVLPITNYFHREYTSPQEQKFSGRTEKITFFRDPYFVISKDNKLFNWGYLYEFKNDPSNKGGQFGLAMEDGYKNYLRLKGEEYVR